MVNTVTAVGNPATWTNADGLQVRFGITEARDAVVGKATNYGDDQQLIVDLDYKKMPVFSASENIGVIYGGISNNCIPSGALITAVEMITITAFTGSGATLSVGLVKADGTEIDNDGLLDAVALTSMDEIGESFTTGGALVGKANGAKLSDNGYIWVTVQTATYTAGQARLKITYFIPSTVTGTDTP